MPADAFGVYVKTFAPDHHLAQALVASLERFAPGISITIVPDDDHRQDDFFGERVLRIEDPFFARLRGYFKKLWVFFGHYERFLYLDADTLTIRDLAPLVALISGASAPFFMACPESWHAQSWSAASARSRRATSTSMIGDLSLIEQLDSQWNPVASIPFPSGVFAGSRGCISLEALKVAHARGMELNARHGHPPLGTSRAGIFMGDQGLVNYLVRKAGIPVTLLPDVFLWGDRRKWIGRRPTFKLDESPVAGSFITWSGCPRPTLLRTNVPYGRDWYRAYREFHRRRARPLESALAATRCVVGDVRARSRAFFRQG